MMSPNVNPRELTRPGRGVAHKMLAAGVAGLLTVAATGCGGGGGSGGEQDKSWVHAIVTPKGDAGYILMAQEKKYYKEQGIDVKIKSFTGNIPLNQALASGDVDSIETSPDPVFDAATKGGNAKIIGSTLPGLTYAVIAQKNVKSFADLRGKKIGVSLPGSLPDVAARAMVEHEGMDSKSVKAVNVGNDAQRFQAVSAGRVEAAAVSSEFVPRAEASGKLHVLGVAEEMLPKYPRFMIAANGDSLEEKPDTAVKFLAATMQGISHAAANRDEALKISAKTLKTEPSDESLTYFYDRIRKYDAASPRCEVPMDKLKWLQNYRLKAGLQKERVNLDEIVDTSYQKKALKRVGDKLEEPEDGQ
ncbi:MAG: PhnD/SsuA/transferrin family substrate-binding protein [Streptosporangiales bacterium]|nr:PhnD/SsuA/transferrin family substrate-binding protein [Streptosporangiales bacterium]